MTYPRYIERKGKVYGPYYYKSVRDEDGNVLNIYVGRSMPGGIAASQTESSITQGNSHAHLERMPIGNIPDESISILPSATKLPQELPQETAIQSGRMTSKKGTASMKFIRREKYLIACVALILLSMAAMPFLENKSTGLFLYSANQSINETILMEVNGFVPADSVVYIELQGQSMTYPISSFIASPDNISSQGDLAGYYISTIEIGTDGLSAPDQSGNYTIIASIFYNGTELANASQEISVTPEAASGNASIAPDNTTIIPNETAANQTALPSDMNASLNVTPDQTNQTIPDNQTVQTATANQIGIEYNSTSGVYRIWNYNDNYYISAASGIQLTNHYQNYWSDNRWCVYVKVGQWRKLCANDFSWNWSASSDNLTYANLTGYTSKSYPGGYKIDASYEYYLRDNDTTIRITPTIFNNGKAFTGWLIWRIQDIQIGMTKENDVIQLNGDSWPLNDQLNLEYPNDVTGRMFSLLDMDLGEHLEMYWNESIWIGNVQQDNNYTLKIKSESGQYNSPVELWSYIDSLPQGSNFTTSYQWIDGPPIPVFVAPTSANATTLYVRYSYINWTDFNTVTSGRLNWYNSTNTNYTASCTGKYCYLNMSQTADFTLNYTGYLTNSSGENRTKTNTLIFDVKPDPYFVAATLANATTGPNRYVEINTTSKGANNLNCTLEWVWTNNQSRQNISVAVTGSTYCYYNISIPSTNGLYYYRVYMNDGPSLYNVSQDRAYTSQQSLTQPYYVAPTSANATTLYLTYSYINWTDYNAASSGRLNWYNSTNTNYTASCAGKYCYLNMSQTSDFTLNYTGYITNGTGENLTKTNTLIFDVIPDPYFVAATLANATTGPNRYVEINTTSKGANNLNCTLEWVWTNNQSRQNISVAVTGSTYCYYNISIPSTNGLYYYRVYMNDGPSLYNVSQDRAYTSQQSLTQPYYVAPTSANATTLYLTYSYINWTDYNAASSGRLNWYNSTNTNYTASCAGKYCYLNMSQTSDFTLNYTGYTTNGTGENLTKTNTLIFDVIPDPYFVAATLANATTGPNRYVEINTTSKGANNLNCTLEWVWTNNQSRQNISVAVTGSTYCYYNISIPSTNGLYYYRAYLNDGTLYNVSEDRAYTLDNIPPSPIFISPTLTNNTNSTLKYIEVNVSSSETLNACVLDWSGVNESGTITLGGKYCYINKTGLGDGSYYFRMYVNDTAGNMNVTEDRQITVDTTLPSPIFASPTLVNNTNTTNSYIEVNVSAGETLHTCVLNWNGVNQSYAPAGKYCYINNTGLTDGMSYYFKVYANDTAGNMNVTEDRKVSIDFPPTFSLNSTNGTEAGTYIEHRLFWQDATNLSGYVFSFFNGSNTSAMAFSDLESNTINYTASTGPGTTPTFYYNYSEGWQGQSGTTQKNALQLAFTPESGSRYLVLGYAEGNNSATTSETRVNVSINNVQQYYFTDRPGVALTEYMPYSFAEIYQGAGSSVTYKIEFASSAATVAGLRRARIFAIRLDNLNNSDYNWTYDGVGATVDNVWANAAGDTENITLSPSSNGYYLIYGTSSVGAGIVSSSASMRLSIDGSVEYLPALLGRELTWSYARIQDRAVTENVSFGVMAVRYLNNSQTHTLSLQLADIDAAPSAHWTDTSLVAVRLSDVFNFFNGTTVAEANTVSTTSQNRTLVNIPANNAGNYMIIGDQSFQGSSAAVSFEQRLNVDNTEYGISVRMPVSVNDYIPNAFIENLTLGSGSHYAVNQYRRTGASGTAYVKNSELALVYLDQSTLGNVNTNKSYTTYNNIPGTVYEDIKAINVTVNVSIFNTTGSQARANTNPDLWLEMYNGTDFQSIGGFSLAGIGNDSFYVTTPSILSAWKIAANRDLRIRGVYMDYYNGGQRDEINYTDVWVNVTSSQELINDSWVSFTGTQNWSNVTKFVNSIVGTTIKWRVYGNDTAGNWNTSQTFQYVTIPISLPDLWFDTPTLSNGTNITVNNIEVNVSSDEVLHTCTLEWNGVNQSYAPTGSKYCYINKASLSEGSYYFRVYANNSAGRMNVTEDRKIFSDQSAPTCSISSITEGTNPDYQYASAADTIYYSTAATGSFTVAATASDSGSGVQKVNFPATVNSGGGDDTTSPYSMLYTWAITDTYNTAATVTAYDYTARTGTCTLYVYRDTTAPAAGSISFSDGYYTTASVPITFADGTDSGSGVNASAGHLFRQSATLTDNTCGSYGAWSAIDLYDPSSPYTDNSVANGNCYSYIYMIADNVKNGFNYTTASIAKIDTVLPSPIFASPTLVNQTATPSNFIEVNVSAGETLHTCVLNWNGVNQSYAPAGKYCYINMTSLSEGAYYFKVYANDSAGNMNVTEDRRIYSDQAAPTCSISSITEGTNPDYQYASAADTIYYSTAATGSFTVASTASDSGSGVQKVNFPATVNSGGGDDATSPYSMLYTWAITDVYNAAATATAYDYASRTGTCTFYVYRDTTAPATGSISYSDGYYTTASVPVTFADGTDGGSGVNASAGHLFRQSAILTDTSCGSYGAWTAIGPYDPTSVYTDNSVANGNCYSYEYMVADNVRNGFNYTTTSIAKIDTVLPSPAFASPTLVNQTATPSNFIEVNVSAGETLNTCVLNWNDVNQSYAPAGKYCYINKASLSDGSYYFRVYANDSAGNMNVTEDRMITLDNPPYYSLNSTNGTGSGTYVEHRLFWQDAINMSGYIFSFYNGSNTSSSSLSTDQEASIVQYNAAVTSSDVITGQRAPWSSGHNVNQWTTPANVRLSDNVYATAGTVNFAEDWYNFTSPSKMSVPLNATINGLLVTIEASSSGATSRVAYTNISNDGGATYKTCVVITRASATDANSTCGGYTNLLGFSWTPAMINDEAANGLMIYGQRISASGGNTMRFDYIGVDVNYTQYFGDVNVNKSYTTYNNVILNDLSQEIKNITVTVSVDSYSNGGSTKAGNANPDLWLEMYNGTDWVNISGFGISGAGNDSIVVTNANILSTWQIASNRDIRLMGVYFDAYNTSSTTIDNLTYSQVWVQMNSTYDLINDSWVSFTGTQNWSNVTKFVNIADGTTIKWKVYANDSGGNWNSTPIFSYMTTDSIPPSPVFASPTLANNTNSTNKYIEVNVSAGETLHTCVLNWNGVNQSYAPSGKYCYINMTGLNDAAYYFKVYANDTAGNMNVTEDRQITIDTTLPSPIFASPTPANNTNTTGNYIEVNVSAGETLHTCVLNWNNVNQSYAPAGKYCYINKTSLSEGAYYFKVYANDTAGNMNVTEDRRIFSDQAAPTCSISSITEGTNPDYQYASAIDTIYYSTATTGSFTVAATASDSGSGVQKVNFPATVNSGGGDDTTSPYSMLYTWAITDTYNTAATVTAYDYAARTGTCTFYVYRDVTAPAAGSISFSDGYYTTASVPITFADGTDSGSGVNASSGHLFRQSATLTDTACGSYGAWSAIDLYDPSSPYTDNSVANGNCYSYIYMIADNVKNGFNYTTASIAKIDTVLPSLIFASPTLANQTASTNKYIEVNVSAAETLYTCVLNWNGVNESYAPSGKYCYINMTGLSDAAYYFKVYANDSAGNMNVTEDRRIDVATKITVQSISILPDEGDPGVVVNPLEGSNKQVSVTVTVVNTTTLDTCFVRIFNASKSYSDPVFSYTGTIQNCAASCECFKQWGIEYWRNQGDWNVSVYINQTNGVSSFTSGLFTYNYLTSINVNTSTVIFAGIPEQNVNASDGYPMLLSNTGNQIVNIDIKGSDFTGVSQPSYVVGVGNSTYSNLPNGAYQQLTGSFVQVFQNLGPAESKTLHFRAYFPVGFIQQYYQGTIEITTA